MADTIITFTIPDDKIQRVKDALSGLFPIPLDDDNNPLFTEGQWAKEKVKRWIVEQVNRWENKLAQESVTTSPDYSLLS